MASKKNEHTPNSKKSGLILLLSGIAVCFLSGFLILWHIVFPTIGVGDSIVFSQASLDIGGIYPRIRVEHIEDPGASIGTRVCVLDIKTMLSHEGSLMVMEILAQDYLLVHWQGRKTFEGDLNCGTSVDLMMSKQSFRVAAFGAGNINQDRKEYSPRKTRTDPETR